MPAAAASIEAGTTGTVYADGLAVHTVEWRTPRSHPDRRVLLLHGLGANTLSWEPFAGPLADRLDAVVTAVDLAGFGRTRAPAGRAPATIELQTGDQPIVMCRLRRVGYAACRAPRVLEMKGLTDA